MNETVISLTDVEKRYGRHKVLSIAAIKFQLNSRMTLRGSNGSGKSTLLRIIAGIAVPTHGLVWRDLPKLGTRLGYVPQLGGLIDELSVDANFDQRRRLCGLSHNPKRKAELLGRAGLTDSKSKRFADLSGGRQRLAAIAAALYTEPSWLLIDEPFAGVDNTWRSEVERVVEEWVPRSRLLIVTSPESEELLFAASETVSLKNGSIQC